MDLARFHACFLQRYKCFGKLCLVHTWVSPPFSAVKMFVTEEPWNMRAVYLEGGSGLLRRIYYKKRSFLNCSVVYNCNQTAQWFASSASSCSQLYPLKFILYLKLIGMSMKRLGTAWLCFPRSCGRMSWGKTDYSSTSQSGGGYAHARQCGLNLKAFTIWSLG